MNPGNSRMLNFKDILRGRVVLVDLLVVFFGISAWISINGLWVELPLLVNYLPEKWALPSYLSIIVQIANIGPITYGLLRSLLPNPPPPHLVIILLLLLGCGASLGLVLIWDLTAVLLGSERSVGLFIFVFFLSLVDCTSSVLFLPYMGLFRDIYLNSYLVGEGMSGFVPAITALIQGVGGNPTCVNQTQEDGSWKPMPYYPPARFSVSAFFLFLLAMMIISLIAFLLLQYLSVAKEEKVSKTQLIYTQKRRTSNSDSTASNSSTGIARQDDESDEPHVGEDLEVAGEGRPRYSVLSLLLLQAFVCFLSNGFLPSIQSYSCLPYGNVVYHVAATLHAMANPLMAFLAMFLPCYKQRTVWLLSLAGCLTTGYIIATALYSPGDLGGTWGGACTVVCWVLSGAIFSYVKVSVAGLCREAKALFYCGAATQVGSSGGALIAFLLVNQVELFQGYYVTC